MYRHLCPLSHRSSTTQPASPSRTRQSSCFTGKRLEVARLVSHGSLLSRGKGSTVRHAHDPKNWTCTLFDWPLESRRKMRIQRKIQFSKQSTESTTDIDGHEAYLSKPRYSYIMSQRHPCNTLILSYTSILYPWVGHVCVTGFLRVSQEAGSLGVWRGVCMVIC